MDTNQKERREPRRICVSGIGMISAAGNDTDASFANMLAGKRRPMPSPSLFESQICKPVFECSSDSLDQSLLPHMRTFALCLKALEEALADARICLGDLRMMNAGVSIGTTVSCNLNDLEFYSILRGGGHPGILPLKRYLCGDISLSLAEIAGLETLPLLSVANACSSGANAIAVGASLIRSGACDIAIVGGADELNRIPYCGFNSLQVMSDEPCMPFDKRRKGLNLGEGAGIIILEDQGHALSRGHRPLVELASWGEASDAFHITGPHPEGRGLRRAIMLGLERAATNPSDVAYINAHGTATLNNDSVESAVIADIFGSGVKLSSTKYYTGHTLGAAGAIEAALCVKGIIEGSFPGNPGMVKAPDLPVAPASSTIPYAGGKVVSTSMAFGGSCLALLFGRLEYQARPSRAARASIAVPELDAAVEKMTMRITKPCLKKPSSELRCIAVGVVGPFGRGKDQMLEMLKENPFGDGRKNNAHTAFQIPEEVFSSPDLKPMRRRADRLCMAAFCAAEEALSSSSGNQGRSQPFPEDDDTALIVVTPLGAYPTTFRFLDGVLDFGEGAPSPSSFSNSVHNAPAFYITAGLKLLGPSLTVNGFDHPFENAMTLAESMLQNSQNSRVLLVACEVRCSLAPIICDLWNKASPFKIEGSPGEGAAAFMLTLGSEKTGKPMDSHNDKESMELAHNIFGTTLINGAFARIIQLIR